MKKNFLFFISVLAVASVSAQAPTVSTSSVTFQYCQTSSSTKTKQVGQDKFPLTWEGHTFTTYGSTVVVRTNARGCDSIVTLVVEPMEGALPYPFSVASNKKVYFSKGNLQYCANPSSGATTHTTRNGTNTKGVYRFATNQWDRMTSNNANISSAYSGWIDLFRFATSGYKGLMPYTITSPYYFLPDNYTASDYDKTNANIARTNLDWGWFNAISNGGNTTGTWFLLTDTEWQYLLNTRSGASSKYGASTVNGIAGYVLLPDNWSRGAINSSYTSTQWNNNMQPYGAVFLPATGYGNNGISSIGSCAQTNNCYYWTSVIYSSNYIWYYGGTYGLNYKNYYQAHYGCAVRLVRYSE